MNDVSNYHWSEDVQLEVAVCTSNGDGDVVTDDLSAAHSEGFALGWVDFTRHDGAARFVFRKKKFSQTTTRTRSQETDIVSNLHECASSSVKCTREFNEGIIALESLEFVGGSLEFVTSFIGNLFSDGLSETDIGVESSSDSGTTLCEFRNFDKLSFDSSDGVSHLSYVSREFLSEGQGSSILSVGSSDLNDILEFILFMLEGFQECSESR